MIGAEDIPALPRGVRLATDRVRACTVLLGPERVLMIDAIGEAILTRVDGKTPVSALCEDLAQRFAAAREVIEPDVRAYLEDLAGKRLLEVRHG